MDVADFLDQVRRQPWYAGQIEHLEEIPPRDGRFADPERPLPEPLQAMLRAAGIEQLYVHQAQALDLARAAHDLVVVTGTASGKTLCYNLPILETCLARPDARALYLFPTKALAQDQLKNLLELLASEPSVAAGIRPGVYDGDTPTAQRRRIKAEANLVLSNPDMLHASLLPQHSKWARFFSELRYVVLDEAHTYRGIFGAHVACVLRRLQRVCRHYGSQPTFLAASATIANPGELVGRLIGQEVAVVDDDGAPRGRKYFVMWNPSPHRRDTLARRSASDDAVALMTQAIEEDAQVLAFTRTRQQAELLHRYTREGLQNQASSRVDTVRAYRGGYLPNERREIEQALFEGKLKAVAATNALELGIDIGSLDVALMVGYPGTIASTWQQAGRCGRRQDDSLAVLLAANDPIDQYLLRHPEYFLGLSPEQAVVDPENIYVMTRHLKAASFELPLSEDDVEWFGPLTLPLAELLRDAEELNEVAGQFYFAGGSNPAVGISLRHMSDNTFSIVLGDQQPAVGEPPPRGATFTGRATPRQQVIANVDAISAPELIYPEAVYLHNGETYLVRQLDLNGKIAYVERCETDYYTQAVLESTVKITRERDQNPVLPRAVVAFGDADVTWKTVAFKKIRFATRENIGLGPVDIPEQTLPTRALWITPHAEMKQLLKAKGLRISEALVGLKNLAITVLPLVAMSDRSDVGGVVDSKNFGHSTMIVYDRYPGGLGYCERGFEQVVELLDMCHQLVTQCPCVGGCPSCVGLPNQRPAIHSDPDLHRGFPMPDKRAATLLLEQLLAAHLSATNAAE